MIGLLIFNRQQSRGSKGNILFLVLLSCLINTHTYLGLFETFKWMKTTTNPKLYIAFLLFRSVFIPLFVSYITLHILNSPFKKQLLLFLLFILIIMAIDIINLGSHLYSFKKWNHLTTLSYYLLFLFLVILGLKWFRGMGKRGERR